MVLGLLLLWGCGRGDAGTPIDGEWNAALYHSLAFTDGRYESGDPDAVGTCREQGTFQVDGATVTLLPSSKACPEAPRTLVWQGDELLRDGGLVYRRGRVDLVDRVP